MTVEVAPDGLSPLRVALEQAGFTPRVTDLAAFVARTQVLPLVHDPTRMPVDVVLAGSALEEEFLGRARPVDLGGINVPVISPEDLIITKILAGRPKDLEDVRGVVREQGTMLDVKRIRGLLELLEQALERSDLVPELERALAAGQPLKRL